MKFFLKILFLLFIISSQAHAVEEFVLKSEPSFIPNFQNRFTFQVGLNPSVQNTGDITNFTFSYGYKLENYWLDSTILITNGIFNKITTNNPSATGLTSDQLTGTKSLMTTLGVGIGRETSYIQNLLPFKNLYEYMATDLTYNIYKENTSGNTFSGPGMIAKFSLLKRFSDYLSVGTQFTYNLAVVKKAATFETENSSMNSLTMSYLTVGFDLSLFL